MKAGLLTPTTTGEFSVGPGFCSLDRSSFPRQAAKWLSMARARQRSVTGPGCSRCRHYPRGSAPAHRCLLSYEDKEYSLVMIMLFSCSQASHIAWICSVGHLVDKSQAAQVATPTPCVQAHGEHTATRQNFREGGVIRVLSCLVWERFGEEESPHACNASGMKSCFVTSSRFVLMAEPHREHPNLNSTPLPLTVAHCTH